MANDSLADLLVNYLYAKQRIIDDMKSNGLPNQEHELCIGDEIIRQAILHATSVAIKLNCVNKEAFKAGIEVEKTTS